MQKCMRTNTTKVKEKSIYQRQIERIRRSTSIKNIKVMRTDVKVNEDTCKLG